MENECEKEVIIIVDKDDNVIAYKKRGDLDSKKDIYRVTGLWLTNSKKEILFVQRSFNLKHNPGKWGPAVSGTVTKGETYEDNIYKEAEEEIGIKGLRFKLGPKYSTLKRPNVKYLHFTQWFLAEIDKEIDDFELQKEEVEQIKWFSEEEVLKIFKENPDFFSSGIFYWIKLFINK